MSIATGVVGYLYLATVGTAQHMSTELRTAAVFDGRHDLELVKADMSGVCGSPRSTLAAEDIRDLYS